MQEVEKYLELAWLAALQNGVVIKEVEFLSAKSGGTNIETKHHFCGVQLSCELISKKAR